MGQIILRSLLGQQALGRIPAPPAADRPALAGSTSALLRSGLVVGCVFAIGIAAWLGDPAGYLHADPDLARLLRGMALIKGMIVIAAVGAVFWRLAWPLSRTTAATYLVSSWALAGSTMLIWQLSHIVLAAVIFHAAALSLLWVSWREGRAG